MKKAGLKAVPFLLLLVFIVVSGCKKTTQETDDPNITYVNLNKQLGVVPSGPPAIDSIDFNNDGLAELMMVVQNVGADTGYVIFNQKSQGLEMVIGGIVPLPYGRILASGDEIPTSAAQFYQTVYPTYKASGYRLGLLSGEGYLAFRFKTGTKFQYGWMKVSLNAAFTELRVLEYAYSLQYDTPIKVGAK